MVAALPAYVKASSFREAPPGHRFRLYFDAWWTRELEERRVQHSSNRAEVKRGEKRLGNGHKYADFACVDEEGQRENLARMGDIPDSALRLQQAWLERQALIAGEESMVIDAKATSPFVTGMGLEHPIENGFTFLDPYGLPCLPGSSVKGVIRSAAEDLALFGGAGEEKWGIDDVWWLFGVDASAAYLERGESSWRAAYLKTVESLADDRVARLGLLFGGLGGWKKDPRNVLRTLPDSGQAQEAHVRGALRFSDVLPVPPSKAMRVEVMTPHFGDYYRGEKGPTDDQNPIPLYFLALPAGTTFRFEVGGSPPPWLASRWQSLVRRAFSHAFEWMGFGAKTSAGYGKLEIDRAALERREKERARLREQHRAAEKERRLASMSPLDRDIETLHNAAGDANNVVFEVYKKLAAYEGEEKVALAKELKAVFMRWGRWSGVKKKQKDKVDAIKKILGET